MSAQRLAPSAEVTPSRRLAKRFALAVDGALPKSKGAVILAYHRVGGRTASPVDLSLSMFRRQMAHLAATASVDALDAVLGQLRAVDPLDSFSTVLTFDDGTEDFADVVVPVLVEYGLPVTLYLSTAFVDSGRYYPAEGKPLSWSALRESLSTGLVTVGAHTHNHVLLDRCDSATARDELDRSNERIFDELGVLPRHFAYPKAVRPTSAIEALVRARYDSAALAGTKANAASSFDPHRLARSPIQNADGWDGFVRKLGGGMRSEDDIRRVVNLVRYRGKVG